MMDNDNKKPVSEEVQFLHDLATPLSILRMLFKRLEKSRQEGVPLADADAEKVFKMILKAIDTMEGLHAEHKAKIFNKETV